MQRYPYPEGRQSPPQILRAAEIWYDENTYFYRECSSNHKKWFLVKNPLGFSRGFLTKNIYQNKGKIKDRKVYCVCIFERQAF
jgi:hypothetical protein